MKLSVSDGIEKLEQALGALAGQSGKAAKRVLYDGAKVLHQAIQDATEKLTLDEYPFTPGKDPLRVISRKDREDLAQCVGFSPILNEEDGTYSVSVSFDGYITRTEPKFPKGVPAAMIARSIESGSSVRAKKPFVRPAVRKVTDAVNQAMQETFDQTVAYYMEHPDK